MVQDSTKAFLQQCIFAITEVNIYVQDLRWNYKQDETERSAGSPPNQPLGRGVLPSLAPSGSPLREAHPLRIAHQGSDGGKKNLHNNVSWNPERMAVSSLLLTLLALTPLRDYKRMAVSSLLLTLVPLTPLRDFMAISNSAFLISALERSCWALFLDSDSWSFWRLSSPTVLCRSATRSSNCRRSASLRVSRFWDWWGEMFLLKYSLWTGHLTKDHNYHPHYNHSISKCTSYLFSIPFGSSSTYIPLRIPLYAFSFEIHRRPNDMPLHTHTALHASITTHNTGKPCTVHRVCVLTLLRSSCMVPDEDMASLSDRFMDDSLSFSSPSDLDVDASLVFKSSTLLRSEEFWSSRVRTDRFRLSLEACRFWKAFLV